MIDNMDRQQPMSPISVCVALKWPEKISVRSWGGHVRASVPHSWRRQWPEGLSQGISSGLKFHPNAHNAASRTTRHNLCRVVAQQHCMQQWLYANCMHCMQTVNLCQKYGLKLEKMQQKWCRLSDTRIFILGDFWYVSKTHNTWNLFCCNSFKVGVQYNNDYCYRPT